MKRVIIALTFLCFGIGIQAQTPDLSKFQLEIINVVEITGSNLYFVETENYHKYIYDSSTDVLIDKFIYSSNLIILEKEKMWQVIEETSHDINTTTFGQVGTINKSYYDSLHVVGYSSIIGFNTDGLFFMDTDSLNQPVLMENATSIHLTKNEYSDYPSHYPTKFGFSNIFIKYNENGKLNYKGTQISASNQYAIIDIDDRSVAYNITFDEIGKMSSFEGFISGKKDGASIVFSTAKDSIVERGYSQDYLSGCDFLFVLKNSGIGYGRRDNWVTADIGEVVDMEIGHCEDIETKLVLKDGTVKYIDFWEGKIYEEEEWIKSYYEFDEELMKEELQLYYDRQKLRN